MVYGRHILCLRCLRVMFIITDKARASRGGKVKDVKDEELKLEEIESSHTLGGV